MLSSFIKYSTIFVPHRTASPFVHWNMASLLSDHPVKSCEEVSLKNSTFRVRTDSMVSEDSGQEGYKHISKYFVFTTTAESISQFLRAMAPRIKTRAKVYLFFFVVITLLLLARTERTTLYGCSAAQWYEFIGLVFIFDIIFAGLDELFFIIVDQLWIGRDDIRLFVHCLSGPAGYILLTVYFNTVHGRLQIRHSLPFWDTLMSMVILALFIFVFRQFLTRGNYNSIIVDRFQGRLKQLETRMKILSLLASWHPRPMDMKISPQSLPSRAARSKTPHDSSTHHSEEERDESPHSEGGDTESSNQHLLSSGANGDGGSMRGITNTLSQTNDDVSSANQGGAGRATRHASGDSDDAKSIGDADESKAEKRQLSFKKKSVAREVFKEIVEASKDVVHESQEVYLSFSLLYVNSRSCHVTHLIDYAHP
jgi:hypothetical protein